MEYTRQHYISEEKPRWCAGCGDFGILKSLTDAFLESQIPPEKLVVVSGIGCASRLPYYTASYGFHTLHGRAPTVATGIRLARPDFHVWMITGDGDGLSIGGNHLLHMLRRNPNIKVVLFNNQIYGLTKGQTSPTSPVETHTKSTPFGSVDTPVNPLKFALMAGATFVARTVDRDNKHMKQMFIEAEKHKGVAFIEVLQNCIVFNDGAFEHVTDKKQKIESALYLENGQKLNYGSEAANGLAFKEGQLAKVAGGDAHVATHDWQNANPAYANALAEAMHPEFPVPLGIFRKVEKPIYEEAWAAKHPN